MNAYPLKWSFEPKTAENRITAANFHIVASQPENVACDNISQRQNKFWYNAFLLFFYANQGVHEPKNILVLNKIARNLPPWPNKRDKSIEKGVLTNKRVIFVHILWCLTYVNVFIFVDISKLWDVMSFISHKWMKTRSMLPFNAWCPLECQTYLSKTAAFIYRFA